MVLLLFPVVPVVVLKRIMPVDVLGLSMYELLIVLFVASFNRVKTEFEALVFLNLRYLPLPPERPSTTVRSAPFSRIIPFATVPEINLKVLVLGCMVTV